MSDNIENEYERGHSSQHLNEPFGQDPIQLDENKKSLTDRDQGQVDQQENKNTQQTSGLEENGSGKSKTQVFDFEAKSELTLSGKNIQPEASLTQQTHQDLLQSRKASKAHIKEIEEEIREQQRRKHTQHKEKETDSLKNDQSNEIEEEVIEKQSLIKADTSQQLNATSNTTGTGQSSVSYYQNPNNQNTLSEMNISRLSEAAGAKQKTLQTAPGMFVEGADAFKLFQFITLEDHKGLLQYLFIKKQQTKKSLDLFNMNDARKFSLLTYAAYRNQTNCFQILFDYAFKYCQDQEIPSNSLAVRMKEWVNQITTDHFTALHFAVRHGNLRIMELLCEKGGADMYIVNQFGSSPIHIAAQQDQPLSLYYLWKQGVDINLRDQKGGAPLHWACFTRSETALNYILSLKPDLEAKDIFGQTALHIAVTCVEKLGSCRNVKMLLLRGADRETKDKKGKTPREIIPENMEEHRQDELYTYLKPPKFTECLMVRIPLVPLNRNHNTQILFISLFSVVSILNLIIILPTLELHLSNVTQVGNMVSTAFVFFMFLLASFQNPGILKPDEDKQFMELLNDINPADLCPECKLIRTARSRHCAICNQCVERFDHHCPWINNCVGIKNHNTFMIFLFSIWIKICVTLYFDIDSLVVFWKLEEDFLCDQQHCIDVCLQKLCTNKYVHISSCFICIFICLFYLFLSSALLFTHLKNYAAARTTNERFAKKPVIEDEDLNQSMLTVSDLDLSREGTGNSRGRSTAKRTAKKRSCFGNCWRMCNNTKITSQNRLYNYLAEPQNILSESEVSLSRAAKDQRKLISDNSKSSGQNDPFSQGNSAILQDISM